MKLLNNNFSKFKELYEEYEQLKTKKTTLEKELVTVDSTWAKELMSKEIQKLDRDIKLYEDAKLYTQRGIDNLKSWGSI